jgi:2'-5' RNA ligase
MYDEKELNCIRINSQLQSAIQLEGTKSLSPYESVNFSPPITNIYRKQFADNNCTQLIEQYRQAELGSVVDKFTNLDKVRIESESIYERNQRIFFGGLVLVAGIVILTMFSKKK